MIHILDQLLDYPQLPEGPESSKASLLLLTEWYISNFGHSNGHQVVFRVQSVYSRGFREFPIDDVTVDLETISVHVQKESAIFHILYMYSLSHSVCIVIVYSILRGLFHFNRERGREREIRPF